MDGVALGCERRIAEHGCWPAGRIARMDYDPADTMFASETQDFVLLGSVPPVLYLCLSLGEARTCRRADEDIAQKRLSFAQA